MTDLPILTYGGTPDEGVSNLIYLDKGRKASILIRQLPKNLADHTRRNFEKMFSYHPEQRGVVLTANASDTDESDDLKVQCDRWYQSYLNTPKWSPEHKTSYMFSGPKPEPQPELPPEFEELLKWINFDRLVKYNQVIANWYENGRDYIPFHSDYEYNAVPASGVSVLNLIAKDDMLRIFVLKSKSPDAFYSRVEIPLYHGRIIEMLGDTQQLYRHGVPKTLINKPDPGHRISLSFRSFQ